MTAAMWAVSPMLIKEGLRGARAWDVNPIKSIGFIFTMLIAMLLLQPGKWPTVTPVLVMGVFLNVIISNVLGDQCQIYSIKKIGVSLAVSIGCGYPLITTVFSILMLGEKITILIWIGTILIILGLLVIKSDTTSKKSTNREYDVNYMKSREEKLKGLMFALAAAILWGVNMPYLKVLMTAAGWSGTEAYFLRSIALFLMSWGIRAVQYKKFRHSIRALDKIPRKSLRALLVSGVFGLGVGGILFATCIEVLPVSVVTPITASSPLITVILSRIFLRERLSNLQCVGIALVVAGSVSVSL
jgi:drug/metabolite transporter (DMT)-like permease